MDENNKVVEDVLETPETIESEENTQVDSPTPEQTTGEVESEASLEAETEESTPKRGFESRVKELNQRAKEAERRAQTAEERANSFEQRFAELTGSVEPQQRYQPQQNQQPVYDEPIVKPGEEIDAVELDRRIREREQRILSQADAKNELMIRLSEARQRINTEAQQVIRQHPELDPDSDKFDSELSDSVTEATLAYTRSNPYTASVSKFVDKLMKPYQRAVAKEVGKANENLAKQVSQGALRPTPIRKQEKTASEKSIAELEQELGVVTN